MGKVDNKKSKTGASKLQIIFKYSSMQFSSPISSSGSSSSASRFLE
jgi:hypothetical protein